MKCLPKTKKITKKEEKNLTNQKDIELMFSLKDYEKNYLVYVVNDRISLNSLINYFSYLFKKIIKR